jgi:hypothetical protein
VLFEHLPGEAQYQPAIRDQHVLPPSVRFKEILILFVQPAINLDGKFEVWECDVDVVDAAFEEYGEVCLPTSEPCGAENAVSETLRSGAERDIDRIGALERGKVDGSQRGRRITQASTLDDQLDRNVTAAEDSPSDSPAS